LKIVSRIVDYLDNVHRYAVSAPWFSVHKNKKTKQNKTKQSKKNQPQNNITQTDCTKMDGRHNCSSSYQ
jgi:hypothetical protein